MKLIYLLLKQKFYETLQDFMYWLLYPFSIKCGKRIFTFSSSLIQNTFVLNSLNGVLESLSPLKNLPLIYPSSNLFNPWGFPPSPSFCRSHKIVEGGRNYTKIPLSSGEGKHMDLYVVIKREQNTLKKYPKNEDLSF